MVVESTEIVVTHQQLPLEMSVEGVFVRQWGKRGEGQQGKFRRPSAVVVCTWGQEIVVSDTSNHRIQVFGLDGTFL